MQPKSAPISIPQNLFSVCVVHRTDPESTMGSSDTEVYESYTEYSVLNDITGQWSRDAFGRTLDDRNKYADKYTLDVKVYGGYTVDWMKLEQTCCNTYDSSDCYTASYQNDEDVTNVHGYNFAGTPWVGAWRVVQKLGFNDEYVCDNNKMTIKALWGQQVSATFDEREVSSIDARDTVQYPSLEVHYA